MFRSLLSNIRRRRFFNLVLFYFFFHWFRHFSTSLLPPHFLNQGLTLEQMMIGSWLVFLAAALLQIFKQQYSSRRAWYLASFSVLLSLLLVIKISSVWQYYLSSIIRGWAVVLFYLSYNVAHFQLTPKHRTAFSSAILFNINTLITLGAPLAAGLLAAISYRYIWLLSGFFFLLPLFLVRRQKNFSVHYHLGQGIQAIKATRWFIFLEGVWEAIPFAIIPVFSLYFIHSPLYYGTYLAYLSLMGVLANFLLGRFSDQLQKRLVFLYPLTLAMAGLTFLFPLSLTKTVVWLMVTGATQFLVPLFWNVSTSLVVDSHADLKQAMTAREFLLSSGRVIGIGLTAINFSFQSQPTLIFYFLGLVMLLYPLILFYNTKISRRYQYL